MKANPDSRKNMYSFTHESENFPKNPQGYIKNVVLILLAFASTFYPRIINAVGAPSIINFIHFLIVPFTLGIVIAKTQTKNRLQIKTSWEIIFGLLILLVVILASALLNHAGVINVFLDFILVSEPFMLLVAIVCLPLSIASWRKLRYWLLVSSVINLVLAILQYFLLITHVIVRNTRYTLEDNVQGVFYISGAGNYVSASVSLSIAFYYFINAKSSPLWLRILFVITALYQLVASDSKQVLMVFAIAWLILVLTKFNDFRKLILYFAGIVICMGSFYWAIENLNLESLEGFKNWADRTYLYTPNGEGMRVKLTGINMIIPYFQSPLNWLFGLGPGHTVSRLGGWVLRDYRNMLIALGATTHPVTEQVWAFVNSNWLVLESSMFIPLFSWAGIWGDLGFLGLATYLYLGYIVWSRLCRDDFSKLLMLTLFIYGLIITQMEEPGQTMTVAILIGLQWHQRQISRQSLSPQAHQ